MKFADIHNPAAAAKVIRDFQKRFSAKVCLAPFDNCDGGIVAAHSLSRQSMLRPISKNGHVYCLKSNLYNSSDKKSPFSIELVGIGDTSTFNGFCRHHDNNLFLPIEDAEFICSPEQLFLYAYRAVAKESYLKRKQAEGLPAPEVFKGIHGVADDVGVQFSDAALIHMAASLKGAQEIENLKGQLDLHLLNKTWNRIITTIIPFEQVPPVVCSFVYSPDFDFEGNYLQDFENMGKDLEQLIVTILPAKNGGYALLSRLDTSSDACHKMINSLSKQKDISSSMLWYVICQTENFAINPCWYETLLPEEKEKIVAAIDAAANPFSGSVNNLRNCNLKGEDWGTNKPFEI